MLLYIHRIFLSSLFLLFYFVLPSDASEMDMSKTLDVSINHLSDLVDNKTLSLPDQKKLEPLLDFVIKNKEESVHYNGGKRDNLNSAYHEFDVKMGLSELLKYTFNPEIPSNVFRPSSVRFSKWLSADGGNVEFPKLWERLPDLDKPFFFRGIEREEITPDANTGGYYSYDMDKYMLLMRHRGSNVFIAVSRQSGESSTGQKGLVVGADSDWNYVYSGEKGLTKRGLGWVDSRMYKSFSIAIYYEMKTAGGSVRCATFKWLSAGWSGINVVKSEHIYNGLLRYSNDFKSLLEDPRLPSAEELSSRLSPIMALSLNEMQLKTSPLLVFLMKRMDEDKDLSRKVFASRIKDGSYFKKMSEDQVRGALILEEMKCILEKGCTTPSLRPSSMFNFFKIDVFS